VVDGIGGLVGYAVRNAVISPHGEADAGGGGGRWRNRYRSYADLLMCGREDRPFDSARQARSRRRGSHPMPRRTPLVLARLAIPVAILVGIGIHNLSPGAVAASTAVVKPVGTPEQVALFNDLPKPPSGSTKWTNAQQETLRGVLTFDQTVDAYFEPSAQATAMTAEKTRGLQYSVRVNWITEDGDNYVEAFILHYATPAGALDFYQGQLKVNAAHYDTTGGGTVPGAVNSKLLVKGEPDTDGNDAAQGWAVAGANVISIYSLSPDAPAVSADTALMSAEYQALCGAAGCTSAP
jgi:hypothetical protein